MKSQPEQVFSTRKHSNDLHKNDSEMQATSFSTHEGRKRSQHDIQRAPKQSAPKRRLLNDQRSHKHLPDVHIPTAQRHSRSGRSSEYTKDNIASARQQLDLNSVTCADSSAAHDGAGISQQDMASPQSLSLPSPSASPIITALEDNLSGEIVDEQSVEGFASDRNEFKKLNHLLQNHQQATSMMQIPSMLHTFDELPQHIQSYLMYHLLKRCNKGTLQIVAGIVNPALKRDFLNLLPYELSLHVLSYLDASSLTRAAQVSRRWRDIVDEDEYTWKNRIEADQYHIEDGELERAIQESWGLRSPVKARRLSVYPDSTGLKNTASLQSTPHIVKDHFEEMVNGGLKQPIVGQHVYKAIYQRHHTNYQTWMNPKRPPKHLSFESHGRHVVTCLQLDHENIITGSEDANINIFDVRTGELKMTLEGHEGGVWALQYLGNILVSGSTDRTVRIWNMTSGQCLQVFEGHTSTVRCLQIIPLPNCPETESDRHLIITGSRDSTLRIWKLPQLDEPSQNASRSPASNVSEDGNVYFVRALLGHSQSVRAIAADHDTLVSGSYDCSVRVWRISSGKCIWRLTGHSEKVYSVVLDTKQNRCISGSMDWKVKIWDLMSGGCLYTLDGHTSLVGLLSLSHDKLVSAAADSTLRIWNPTDGSSVRTLTAHTGPITCFQHDGDKVISGSDGTLKLWDLKTGKFNRDLLTGLSYVWQVKFDDRRCVAAVQRNNLTYIELLDFGEVSS